MGSGIARQPAPALGPSPGPREELSTAVEGTERSEAGKATTGKVDASPLGQKTRSQGGEKGRGRGQLRRPAWSPRAPPSPPRTHQHDGKPFFQFTWFGHRQLQRHVVRPEISLLRIHTPRVAHVGRTPGSGAALGPSRLRQKSEQLWATGCCPLSRPAGFSALRCAPATVPRAPLPSSARSRAAPRPPSCSLQPQCRPGLSSSGGVVWALGAYLHVVPLARRSLPVIMDSGRVVPPTQPPTRAAATTDTSNPLARCASTSSRQMQLRATDTMPPLARPPAGPAPILAPPTCPADCRDV